MNARIRLAMLCLFLLCGSLAGTLHAQTPPDASPDLQLESFESAQWVVGRANVFLRQPDGRVLVGGRFNRTAGGVQRNALLRLERNGAIDPTFAPNFAGLSTVDVYALAVRDGAIYVGGFFETVNGVTMRSIVRLRMDGSMEPGWNSPFSSAPGNQVRAIAVTGSGLYLGGDTLELGSYGLLRLSPTSGAIDASWVAQTQFGPTATPSAGNRGEIRAMLAVGDDLVVAGQFGQVAGVARTGIARISQAVPVAVRAFDAQLSGRVDALQAAGNQLYIGGTFFHSNPAVNYLGRIDATSAVFDAGWVPNISGSVTALQLVADRLYVGGAFTNQPPGGARLARIALNGNGTVEAGFNPLVDNSVTALADSCRGHLLVGGPYTAIGATVRNGFAAFGVPQIDCIFFGDFEVH